MRLLSCVVQPSQRLCATRVALGLSRPNMVRTSELGNFGRVIRGKLLVVDCPLDRRPQRRQPTADGADFRALRNSSIAQCLKISAGQRGHSLVGNCGRADEIDVDRLGLS